MKTTDTSEKGLEALIVAHLTGRKAGTPPPKGATGEDRPTYGSAGYVEGDPADYDRDHAVDLARLLDFFRATQPEIVEQLGLDEDSPKRQQFLHRLQGEVAKRGVVDVMRRGVKHGPAHVDLFYGTPSPGNETAAARYAANVFSVTRQLRYSKDETQLALDLALFVNGLPVATFELKNRLTKQTVEDAVEQYKRDRHPRELLFKFGRCLVHFAVDDQEVRFCTHLQGKTSWFLPFNKGYKDGAGNPPNPDGLKTDYLWREILTREGLTDIIENYAQIVEEKDEKTGKKKRKQIFPRFHQLDVVRALLADAAKNGAGQRYLIQHSAGSGKSNSIAWLAHQLVGLERDSQVVFDSIVVVTDRRVLDRQIRNTIKDFAQVKAVVGHAKRAGDLRRMLAASKKIIISTVQKFPFILDEIGDEHRGRRFAILIDEAHSSQGGRTAAQMNIALSEQGGEEEDETFEDKINHIMEARKMLPNASYFAFTATPKNKTLEVFGEPYQEGSKTKHRPFHPYTMKQAIQEGFIMDVLKNYTPIDSYYRLEKKIEDDPAFDTKKAQKKLRRYVEGHEHAVRQKAEIMVDHFLDKVLARRKVGGEARAMVVTSRIVLDFANDADTMRKAFEPYYRTTILAEETDPNKLHDLKADLDGHQVYAREQVDTLAELYLSGADRDRLDPFLDACVAVYTEDLDEEGQIDFKGKARAFVRTYEFLASILPYSNAEWEKLSIFLRFLVPKLPTPQGEDPAKGILEAIDMESYRVEAQVAVDIALADQDAEIDPVPVSGSAHAPEPEVDVLSNIIRAFNDYFGNIDWKDAEKIRKVISEEIPAKVAANTAYQNAKKHSDQQNARIEHDKALQRVMIELLADHTELFKQFSDNQSFKKWLSDTIFLLTYESQKEA